MMIQVRVPPPFVEPFSHPILKLEENPAMFLLVVARISPSGHPSRIFLVCGSMPYSSRTGDGDVVSLFPIFSSLYVSIPHLPVAFCPISLPLRSTSPYTYGPYVSGAYAISKS